MHFIYYGAEDLICDLIFAKKNNAALLKAKNSCMYHQETNRNRTNNNIALNEANQSQHNATVHSIQSDAMRSDK